MRPPRERTMPLVPEPFKHLCTSRQSVLLRGTPMAQSCAGFCPNLDIPQYRETLSEDKKTELDMRATKLSKGAIVNQLYHSSEFGWEVSAWRDAFGLIMDDEGLRMDKRSYEYVSESDSGESAVKTRIPDATLGLKAYDNFDLERGYICTVQGCKDDHSTKQPDERLSKDRLSAMMHNHNCGLVVDGVWGKTDLVFPFAVYEAKKRASSFEAAEDQIYHACKTYLAMLDDLARNPDNVAEYQKEDSSQYQLFAFTSCGPYWEVYIAWNLFESCHVETIWEGDVKEFVHAFELICIIDQVHDYASNNHRAFVMKHLEAWHTLHEKSLESTRALFHAFDDAAPDDGASEDMESSGSDGAYWHPDSDFENLDNFDCDPRVSKDLSRLMFSVKKPEWFDLKQKSKTARQDKARQTRERNRQLRQLSQSRNIKKSSPENKRGRGRPPKAKATKNEASKRRRSQPPKTSAKSMNQTTKSSRITRSSTRTHVGGS